MREKEKNEFEWFVKNCNLELLQQDNSNNPRPNNECHIPAAVAAVCVVVVFVIVDVVGKK